ncbi:MAG: hypothetical protein U0790_10485 [Isosphaeraceae bacterium]
MLLAGRLADPSGISGSEAPSSPSKELAARLVREGLAHGQGYAMLHELCTKVGHRLSGSPGAEKAVAWAKAKMEACGLENVRLEPVLVPHWVRGDLERARYVPSSPSSDGPRQLKVCALGGSVGTPEGGLTAEVLEVRSFDQLRAAGDKARGKIIFFNARSTRGCSSHSPCTASRRGPAARGERHRGGQGGAVGALVRSMTSRLDDRPHAGRCTTTTGCRRPPSAPSAQTSSPPRWGATRASSSPWS